jgi:AcrR family transcriptional regulator
MASKNTSLKDKVVTAMLMLASQQSWSRISLEDITAEAKVDLEEALEYFDDKGDVLAAYGRIVDRKVLDNTSADESEPCRDKLFDLLMERFDVLNQDREAVLSILDGFRGDPKEAVLSFPHLGRSMSRTLEAAGIETSGISGCVKVTGLIGIYLYTVRTWKEDESEDMGKTMATLDKALDRAETLYNSVPFQ